MKYSYPKDVSVWARKSHLFLLLVLGFIVPIQHAHGALFNLVLDFSTIIENDASFTLVVDGVSDGVAFSVTNPAPGTIFEVNLLDDFVNVTASGFANSDPSGDSGLAGRSNAQLEALIQFGEDYAGGSTVEDPTGKFGLLWVAAVAMAWEIDADGSDAFSTTNQGINGPISTLASNSCLSDTLFGDSFNGVDLGTFGSSCSGTTSWSWLSSDLPTSGQAGDFFTKAFSSNDTQAFASTGTYTTTMSFSITSAVPIPAAFWLFGSGLLGLVGIARRKKAA